MFSIRCLRVTTRPLPAIFATTTSQTLAPRPWLALSTSSRHATASTRHFSSQGLAKRRHASLVSITGVVGDSRLRILRRRSSRRPLTLDPAQGNLSAQQQASPRIGHPGVPLPLRRAEPHHSPEASNTKSRSREYCENARNYSGHVAQADESCKQLG